jgi:hypothetical protein
MIDIIDSWIYSGQRTNLLNMISTIRDRRAEWIPHLLTSALLLSLLMYIS